MIVYRLKNHPKSSTFPLGHGMCGFLTRCSRKNTLCPESDTCSGIVDLQHGIGGAGAPPFTAYTLTQSCSKNWSCLQMNSITKLKCPQTFEALKMYLFCFVSVGTNVRLHFSGSLSLSRYQFSSVLKKAGASAQGFSYQKGPAWSHIVVR